VNSTAIDQQLELAASAGALLGKGLARDVVQGWILRHLACAATDVSPGSEELLTEACDIDSCDDPGRCAARALKLGVDLRLHELGFQGRGTRFARDLLAGCDVNHE
jgi:hypothetical protein